MNLLVSNLETIDRAISLIPLFQLLTVNFPEVVELKSFHFQNLQQRPRND